MCWICKQIHRAVSLKSQSKVYPSICVNLAYEYCQSKWKNSGPEETVAPHRNKNEARTLPMSKLTKCRCLNVSEKYIKEVRRKILPCLKISQVKDPACVKIPINIKDAFSGLKLKNFPGLIP